jgi:hypothetical protein
MRWIERFHVGYCCALKRINIGRASKITQPHSILTACSVLPVAEQWRAMQNMGQRTIKSSSADVCRVLRPHRSYRATNLAAALARQFHANQGNKPWGCSRCEDIPGFDDEQVWSYMFRSIQGESYPRLVKPLLCVHEMGEIAANDSGDWKIDKKKRC